MARHGENIYKRKDGRYEGRYVTGKTVDGKTRFGYVYGYRYAQVKNALLQKKTELAKQPAARERCCESTLAQWLACWMEKELLGSVKASSYQTYGNTVNRHLLPALGQVQLSLLTPRMIHDFVAALENSALAHSTVKGIYRLLSAALRSAFEEGLIAQNLCRKIRVQRTEKEEQRVLTQGEQERVKEATVQSGELTALLSLYTGMRLGEVCALKWSDIDWQNKTITVKRTVQRVAQSTNAVSGKKTMLMVGTPKSLRSRRVLPVPDFILALLKERQNGKEECGYLFGGSAAAEPRTVQGRFQRLMKRLGLKGVHFHTLRHSFATRLMELGIDIKTVSELLGHGSARTTLDFYAHSLTEQQRAAMELLAAC